MNIWLLKAGEPVPLPGQPRERLLRTGTLGKLLSERGHHVIWWTSAFSHHKKQFLFPSDADVEVNRNFRISFLRGTGYRSNVSLQRFLDHRVLAYKFSRRAKREAMRPDIIVSALPTVEFCNAAVSAGRQLRIPVVLDMRDMWPDIFIDSVPRMLRPLAKALLMPLFWEARRACAGATTITGITDEFVAWGLERGARKRTSLDMVFSMGYDVIEPGESDLLKAQAFWDAHKVSATDGNLTACFVGSISHQFDVGTILAAAKSVLEKNRKIRFVFCGTGDKLEHYRRMSAGEPNVVFAGWVGASEIYVLLRRSFLAFGPLPDRYDFLSTVNNKAVEYLSAGLPILTCPRRGLLQSLVSERSCGLVYDAGDAAGLASLVMDLAASPQRRQQQSRNARALFLDRFDGAKVYGRMADYFEQLACGGAQRRRGTGNQ